MATKKEVKYGKLTFSLFLASLVLTTLLIGGEAIPTFLMFLAGIALLSAIYAFIKARKFDKAFILEFEIANYTLGFSVFVALVSLILLPYILFGEAILNDYVALWLFLFPTILIFVMALHFFKSKFAKEKISFKIKNSLISSVIVLVVLSAALCISLNLVYNWQVNVFKEGVDYVSHNITEKLAETYPEDLPIFSEIKSELNITLNYAEKSKANSEDFAKNKKLCIIEDCAGAAAENSFDLFKIFFDSGVVSGHFDRAKSELKFLEEGKWVVMNDSSEIALNKVSKDFKANFTTKEKYLHDLKNHLEKNQKIYYGSEEENATLKLLSSKIDYSTLKKFADSQEIPSLGSSPLANSAYFFMLHTKTGKSLIMLATKIKIYLSFQSHNDDLLIKLYDNSGIEEPLDSKIIRYKLIADKLGF